eukprot:5964295-Lingulodinium_polyedra.AAC.1
MPSVAQGRQLGQAAPQNAEPLALGLAPVVHATVVHDAHCALRLSAEDLREARVPTQEGPRRVLDDP